MRARVINLENFTINCGVCNNLLSCAVTDGAARQQERETFCTVNDNPPVECKVIIHKVRYLV